MEDEEMEDEEMEDEHPDVRTQNWHDGKDSR